MHAGVMSSFCVYAYLLGHDACRWEPVSQLYCYYYTTMIEPVNLEPKWSFFWSISFELGYS